MAKMIKGSSFRSIVAVMVLVVMAATVSVVTLPVPVASAASKCPDRPDNGYHGQGPDCIGLDPTGRCDQDALTVASMAIKTTVGYAGQLELRYSPSCRANWARYTPADGWRVWYKNITGEVMDRLSIIPHNGALYVPVGGTVTVWNPGADSQGEVVSGLDASLGSVSEWTKMVDGTITACTGVEPVYVDATEMASTQPMGWQWGPCV